MKHLEHNETFVNTTGKNLLYSVKYLNCLGCWQEQKDVLKPYQSLTKTNPINKVIIYLNTLTQF